MYLLYSVTELKAGFFFYNERSTRTSILLFMHIRNLGFQLTPPHPPTPQKKTNKKTTKNTYKYGTFSLPSHMPIA